MKKDLKYPSNSLYYSAPSKMIETHVTKEEEDRGQKDQKTRYRLLSRAKDQINRGAYKCRRGFTARRRKRIHLSLLEQTEVIAPSDRGKEGKIIETYYRNNGKTENERRKRD